VRIDGTRAGPEGEEDKPKLKQLPMKGETIMRAMWVCIVAALLITALAAEDTSGRQILSHSTAKADALTTNLR